MQIFDPPPEARAAPAPRTARRPPRLPGLPKIAIPSLLRRPLAWVVAAESIVTATFVLAAAHLLATSVPAAPAGAPLPALGPSAVQSPPVPDVSRLLASPGAATPAPRPRLGTGTGFLGGLLSGLNQDQAGFEHQEWSALQALSGAIRTYIEDVVLPAVEKAGHGTASSRSP